jgi:hypothetical protein
MEFAEWRIFNQTNPPIEDMVNYAAAQICKWIVEMFSSSKSKLDMEDFLIRFKTQERTDHKKLSRKKEVSRFPSSKQLKGKLRQALFMERARIRQEEKGQRK